MNLKPLRRRSADSALAAGVEAGTSARVAGAEWRRSRGPAFGAAYGTTKAGLINFTQAIRAEYRGRGISASVICPGFTDEGGIYDQMKAQSGRRSPPLVGSTTVDRVADAVLRAIEKDRAEILVNWPPIRPFMAFLQLFPGLGGSLARAITIRFLKRVAESASE